MEILEPIPITLQTAAVARALRLEGNVDQVRKLLDAAAPLIHARAVYRTCSVESFEGEAVIVGGVRLESRVLRKNLDCVQEVFPFVVTIGPELETYARKAGDLLRQYYLDVIGNLAVRAARQHLALHIQNRRGLPPLSAMNPGSLADWPIQQQRPIFRLLEDGPAAVGVTLTQHLLMVPSKSVSGMFFPAETPFVSCELCPQTHCPARKAGYNEAKASQYLNGDVH